jgi:sugar-specific transcriptional regulator TrmB
MDATLCIQRLAEMGLSKYEASAYVALLGHDESTAVEIADRAGVPRQRIYDVLESLHEKEMVVVREGRPARHTACQPSGALPAMLSARQRQQAAENARLQRLIQELLPDLEQSAARNGSESLLERVLRAAEQSIGGF